MLVPDLPTPALTLDVAALDHNLETMAEALPGSRLRPHVKAHKCTSLARRQAQIGHRTFTCATPREMEGMAAAGLGEDLLLANEVLDASRLGGLDARVTVAVDSPETVQAAARGGVPEVLIDINIGMPRCGVPPARAGEIAALARRRGLQVRGVMGYEGHAVGIADAATRRELTEEAMALLREAHQAVGGEVISTGGTGTYALNTAGTEIQAGSYVLMDTAYAKLGLPFEQALSIVARVISVSPDGYAVADCGLKALGMDHGNPDVENATVLYVADEHVVFVPLGEVHTGDRVRVLPAHCDPTVALHQRIHLIEGEQVVDTWPVDLRGW